MIEKSLIEFLGDENAVGRLLYELAELTNNSDSSFRYKQVQGAIQRDRYIGHSATWMRLIDLPAKGQLNFLLARTFQSEVIGNTSCSVEVYIPGHHRPTWCGPYILALGGTPTEVNQVCGRVNDEVRRRR